MPLETTPFDTAKYLTDPRDQAELVTEAFATGDGEVIRKALDIVTRAREVGRVEADVGRAREGGHEAPAPDDDPKLSTVLRVLDALGVKLSATLQIGDPRQVTDQRT